MGLFNKPEKRDFPELPDNLYFARLAKITQKFGTKSGNAYNSWGFEIVQPPFQKRWVWANTPTTVGPKSITGKFLSELGVDISTIDNSFNEQALIGTYVKVLVETSENKEGNVFQNVTKLMRVNEAEQPLLQQFLAQLSVKGPVRVASQNPTAPHQAPVLAAAPVSLPVQPVAPAAPVLAQPAPVLAPVVATTPAPAAATPKKAGFPF